MEIYIKKLNQTKIKNTIDGWVAAIGGVGGSSSSSSSSGSSSSRGITALDKNWGERRINNRNINKKNI